jgi:hypothetical protein
MRLTYESPKERIDRLTQWHKWFAWHPVEITPNESRWFEFVMRKGTQNPWSLVIHDWPEFLWEYQVIDKPQKVC